MAGENLDKVLDNIDTELNATERGVDTLNNTIERASSEFDDDFEDFSDTVVEATNAVSDVASKANSAADTIGELADWLGESVINTYRLADAEKSLTKDLTNQRQHIGKIFRADWLTDESKGILEDSLKDILNEFRTIISSEDTDNYDFDSYFKNRAQWLYSVAHSNGTVPGTKIKGSDFGRISANLDFGDETIEHASIAVQQLVSDRVKEAVRALGGKLSNGIKDMVAAEVNTINGLLQRVRISAGNDAYDQVESKLGNLGTVTSEGISQVVGDVIKSTKDDIKTSIDNFVSKSRDKIEGELKGSVDDLFDNVLKMFDVDEITETINLSDNFKDSPVDIKYVKEEIGSHIRHWIEAQLHEELNSNLSASTFSEPLKDLAADITERATAAGAAAQDELAKVEEAARQEALAAIVKANKTAYQKYTDATRERSRFLLPYHKDNEQQPARQTNAIDEGIRPLLPGLIDKQRAILEDKNFSESKQRMESAVNDMAALAQRSIASQQKVFEDARSKALADATHAIEKSNSTDADALRKRAALYEKMAEEADAAGKAAEATALYKKRNTDINKANKLDKPVDNKPSVEQAKASKESEAIKRQIAAKDAKIAKLEEQMSKASQREAAKAQKTIEKEKQERQKLAERSAALDKRAAAEAANRASINAKAAEDRASREAIAAEDRASKEKIAAMKNASNEKIAAERDATKNRELDIRERGQRFRELSRQEDTARREARRNAENAIAEKSADVTKADAAVKNAQNTDERIAAYNDLIKAIEEKIETLRDLLESKSEAVNKEDIAKEEKRLGDAQQALRQTLDGVSSEVVAFTKHIKDKLDSIIKDSSLSTEEKAYEVGKLKSEVSSSSTNIPIYNDADLAAYKEVAEQVDATDEKLIKQSAIEDTNRQMAHDVARLEREIGEASTTGDRVAKHRELAEVYRQQAAAVEDLTKREVLLKKANDEDAKAARLLAAEEKSLGDQAKSAMSAFTNIVGMVNAATNKVIGWIRTAVSLENKGINMTVSGARTVVSSLGRVVQLFGNLANRVRSCIAAVVRFAQTTTRALRTILSGVGRLIRGFGSLIGSVRRLITNFGSLGRSVRETKAFSLAFTELNSAISLAERAYNGLFNNQLLEKAFKFDSTIASITMLLGEEATNDTREYASALQDAFGLSFTQTISDLQEITSLLKAAGLEASGISGVQLANAAQDFSAISNYLAALGMAGGDAKEVMSKLESGLKGMTQSIDDLGLSVRENDLNEFLKNKGYNIKFSGLSEANKETVRLAAIIKQFKDSFDISNYASLLDQTYYRVAVIKSQVEEIRTIIGKIFEGIVAKILPVILLAVNSIRKALEGLAVKLDIDIKGNDIQDSLSNIADGVENVEDKEKGAAKAAKEFDGAAGFDELESLNTNSGDSDLNLSGLLADVGSISDALEEAAKNSGSLFDRAAEEVHAKLEELKEKWTEFVEGKLGKGVDPFFGFDWESAKESLGNIKTNIERWWTSFSETGLTLALKIANDAQVGRLTNDVLDFVDSLTKLAAILQEQIAPIIEDFYDKHIAKWLGATSDEIHAFVGDFKTSVNKLDDNLKSGMSFKDAFKDAFELDNPDSRFGKIAKTIEDITTKIDKVGKKIDIIYRLYLRPMLRFASRILGDIWNLYLKPLLGDGGAFSIDGFLNGIINKEKKIVGILEDEQFQLEFHSNVNALFEDVKTTFGNIRALTEGGFTIAGSIFSKDNGGQSLFELVSANYQKFSTDTLQPWIEETSQSVADYIEEHKQEIADFIDMITNELFGVVDKIVELAGKFAAYNIEHPELMQSIGDEANKVLQFISDNFDTIMAIVSYALQILMASIDGLMAGLQTVFDKFNELNTKNEGEDKSSMERIIDRVCKFISKIWKDLGTAIANLMQWAADNEELIDDALGTIEDISGFFSEHIVGVLTAIIGIKTVTTAAGVVTGIKDFFGEKGIGGLLNSVKGLSGTEATDVVGAATSGLNLLQAAIAGLAVAAIYKADETADKVLEEGEKVDNLGESIATKLSSGWDATLGLVSESAGKLFGKGEWIEYGVAKQEEAAKKGLKHDEFIALSDIAGYYSSNAAISSAGLRAMNEYGVHSKDLEPFVKEVTDGNGNIVKTLDTTKLKIDTVTKTLSAEIEGIGYVPVQMYDEYQKKAETNAKKLEEQSEKQTNTLEAVERGISGIPTSVKEAIAETQSETKDAIVSSLNDVKDAILKQDAKAEVEFEFHPDTSKAGMPTNVPVKIRALGGSVPSGNLFIANEAGNPELIGKIGRSAGTDVANRGMITEAMEAAVYNGMVDAINNSRSVSSSSNNESANINISGFGIIDKTTLKKLASMLAPYLDGNKQALTV